MMMTQLLFLNKASHWGAISSWVRDGSPLHVAVRVLCSPLLQVFSSSSSLAFERGKAKLYAP